MKRPVWAALALSAAGCSLIIPLDYTGGVGGSSGSGAAGASQGGSSGVGNAPQGGTSQGAEAGVGNEGGNPQGGAEGGTGGATSPGGTDTGGHGGTTGGTDGGSSGNGGTSGGVGGSSMGGEDAGGEAGTGAAGTSGGGVGGSGGASGGRGGRGGMAGGGMAGTAGCSFDLTSNPMHCGSCTNACPSGNECIDSECVATPCDKLGCTSILMPTNLGDGPRKESLGTGDVCVEVASYTPNAGKLPGINCWNFNSGRVTEVNDVPVVCDNVDKVLSMPKRKGGYCFHAGPGDYPSAGFVMPYSPSDTCCKAPNGGTGGT